ncbi:MAG: rod shape-determining protein MreD [Bacteroidetes bacterium]|nr:rod shape-determining protein MreD [Bacteroidota bacterium]
MINNLIRNSVRFIVLVLLQVLIVQNIRLGSYIILFPYVLFILLLPFETPKLVVLFASFFIGLTIDMFYDTAGIHAAACTMIGFARYYILKLLSPREGYDPGLIPNVESMGPVWFITYSAIIIFIHHLFFFYLEIFRFDEFFRTLLRVLLSTIGTFCFVYIVQFLFYKADRNK